jgi:hypothetical protein
LPVHARLPLIAQITGAVALTALLTAPWWSSIPDRAAVLETSAAAPRPAAVPLSPAVPQSPALAGSSSQLTGTPVRPAHLNLDVRHSFGSVDVSVAVDGKPAFQGKLAGGGKRFKAFGKRAERGYTKTLDLPPGAHVVRVRVLSIADRFDQTRVERFDLESASVATLRVSADKSGLSLVAERPPASAPARAAPPVQPPVAAAVPSPAPAVVSVAAGAVPVAAPAVPQTSQEANAVVDLLQSVRSILIAIAGFVASAATGFVVQEYLRSRRGVLFAAASGDAEQPVPNERRRRRRPGKPRRPRDGDEPESGGEPSSLLAK